MNYRCMKHWEVHAHVHVCTCSSSELFTFCPISQSEFAVCPCRLDCMRLNMPVTSFTIPTHRTRNLYFQPALWLYFVWCVLTLFLSTRVQARAVQSKRWIFDTIVNLQKPWHSTDHFGRSFGLQVLYFLVFPLLGWACFWGARHGMSWHLEGVEQTFWSVGAAVCPASAHSGKLSFSWNFVWVSTTTDWHHAAGGLSCNSTTTFQSVREKLWVATSCHMLESTQVLFGHILFAWVYPCTSRNIRLRGHRDEAQIARRGSLSNDQCAANFSGSDSRQPTELVDFWLHWGLV